MKTENLQTNQEVQDESAAFEASFNGEPKEEPKKEAPKAEPEVVEPVESKVEAAPAPIPQEDDTKAEIRKLHGKIGALNDIIQQNLKASKVEGKPAAAMVLDMKRTMEQYPEIGPLLQEDLMDFVRAMPGQQVDPKQIETLVTERLAKEVAALRADTVTGVHPDWETDLWNNGERTPAYQAWIKTMPETDAQKFESSTNPTYVSGKLTQFYEWKAKAEKAAIDKQSRLQAAVTPQGSAKATAQILSDSEAQQKAFEDAFNT